MLVRELGLHKLRVLELLAVRCMLLGGQRRWALRYAVRLLSGGKSIEKFTMPIRAATGPHVWRHGCDVDKERGVALLGKEIGGGKVVGNGWETRGREAAGGLPEATFKDDMLAGSSSKRKGQKWP